MTRRKATPRTTIGKRLRFARTDVEPMTQYRLAVLSDVHRTMISRIESGFTADPHAATIAALSRALNVRADWLRGEGDTIRPGMYFVYLITANDGSALFVGVCANLPGQLERHKRTSTWVRNMGRVDHAIAYGYHEAMALRDSWVARFVPVWNVQDAAGQSRTNLVRRTRRSA